MEDSVLKVVAFTRDPAVTEVVDYLTGLLERARSGELRAVSILGEIKKRDGSKVFHNGEVGQFADRHALAGQHQYQIHRIMAAFEVAAEAPLDDV